MARKSIKTVIVTHGLVVGPVVVSGISHGAQQ